MAKFKVVVGNIADQKADAIVNAANDRLAPGGGVCGAIFEKAGPELWEEVEENEYYCEPGKVVVTDAYGLDADIIVHAVAPRVSSAGGDGYLISTAYTNALIAAYRDGARSVVFPSLGTGAFGWNIKQATSWAYDGIYMGMYHCPKMREVTFCCFTEQDAAVFREVFEAEIEGGLSFGEPCPKCNQPALPITYGLPTPEDFADPDFYSGGCIVEPGKPSWVCRQCAIEF
jgi:O-acetyl-ADP-ribose deacetylase (regulator of RNase III)